MATGADHKSVPLDVLREFTREEAERTSLRHVAARVGLGRTTVQKFVAGETTPHPRVRRRLALWYLSEQAAASGGAAAEAYGAALDVLVGPLPPALRRATALALVDAVEQAYAAHGAPMPAGLAAARERWRGDDGAAATG